jgi:hypothetical protein
VGLIQQGKNISAVYKTRAGENLALLLNPGWEVEQVVAAVARSIAAWEQVPGWLNNPGAIADEQGGLFQFPSLDAGYWALMEKIHEHFGMRETM